MSKQFNKFGLFKVARKGGVVDVISIHDTNQQAEIERHMRLADTASRYSVHPVVVSMDDAAEDQAEPGAAS